MPGNPENMKSVGLAIWILWDLLAPKGHFALTVLFVSVAAIVSRKRWFQPLLLAACYVFGQPDTQQDATDFLTRNRLMR